MARRSFSPLFLLLLGLASTLEGQGNETYRRFEYKHSFKGPHLVDRQGRVPFWSVVGSTMPSEDQVRLTPSIRSKQGALWNIVPFQQNNWEVEMKFRVTGRGRVGADGLVMWYREKIGEEGPVFGVSDLWKGLGIFFDSFDNDGLSNNPYIVVIVNDGTKQYAHAEDGSSQQLGGCFRDFRNRPNPANVKVTYYDKQLTVWFDNGNTATPIYELCMQAANVDLPAAGHFGLSSATGGLADDHDVLSFLTTSLSPTPFKTNVEMPKDEVVNQFQKSYDEYSEKMESEKEKFQKEHPDAYQNTQMDYETTEEQNIRLALEGQEKLKAMIRDLKAQFDQMPLRVEATASAAGAGASDGSIRQMSARLTDLLNKQIAAESTLESIKNRPATVDIPFTPDMSVQLSQLGAALNRVQGEIQQLRQAPQPGPMAALCEETPNCASTVMIFSLAALQLLLFVIFFYVQKQQQAAAAKKFF